MLLPLFLHSEGTLPSQLSMLDPNIKNEMNKIEKQFFKEVSRNTYFSKGIE